MTKSDYHKTKSESDPQQQVKGTIKVVPFPERTPHTKVTVSVFPHSRELARQLLLRGSSSTDSTEREYAYLTDSFEGCEFRDPESGDLIVKVAKQDYIPVAGKEAHGHVADGADLRHRIGALCAIEILGRHWPAAEEQRQEAAMALGGTLARLGFRESTVERLLECVCRLAGDRGSKKRTSVVASTAKRLNKGGSVFGMTKLKELVGPKVAKCAVEWMGADTIGWGETAIEIAGEPQDANEILTAGNEYRFDSQGMLLIIPAPEDSESDDIERRIANFSAKVTEDRIIDDGLRTQRVFQILASLAGREIPCEVSANEFGRMEWVLPKLGPKAITSADQGSSQHARAAMQSRSGAVVQRRIFSHLGWRQFDGGWGFLHGGGALGLDGVETDLASEGLGRYRLPTFDRGKARDGMLASLGLLELQATRLAYPLWAAVYRAPLCEFLRCSLMPHCEGKTGSFKSSLVAHVLGHFGNFRAKEDLPARWGFTETILEKTAFLAKDVLLAIDDFNPEPGQRRTEDRTGTFSRLVGAIGDVTGRRRSNSNLETKLEYFPQGVVISTGEFTPNLPLSRRARIKKLPFDRGAISSSELSNLQRQTPLLPHAMAGYLTFIRDEFEVRRATTIERFEVVRDQLHSSYPTHARLAENIAHLQIGFASGIEYAVALGLLTPKQAESEIETSLVVLRLLADENEKDLGCNSPIESFLVAVREALAAGNAYLASPKNGKCVRGKLGRAEKLGWIDDRGLYLLPGTAYRFVQGRLNYKGGVHISEDMLKRQLQQDGYLLQNASERGRLEANKHAEGRSHRVLWLRPDALEDVGEEHG